MKKFLASLLTLTMMLSMMVAVQAVDAVPSYYLENISLGTYDFDLEELEEPYELTLPYKGLPYDLDMTVVTSPSAIAGETFSFEQEGVTVSALTLELGDNEVTLDLMKHVDGEDPVKLDTYTFEITTIIPLTDLGVAVNGSQVDLAPEFDSLIFDYELMIPSGAAIILTPDLSTDTDDYPVGATREIYIGDSETPLEGVSIALDTSGFDYGSNPVTVKVVTSVPREGMGPLVLDQVYTIDCIIPPITGLEVKTVETTPAALTLDPSFQADRTMYQTQVAYDINAVTVKVGMSDIVGISDLKIGGQAALAGTPFTVSGLKHGNNEIKITYRYDGRDYLVTLKVARALALQGLKFEYDSDTSTNDASDWKPLHLTPGFEYYILDYDLNVPTTVDEVKLTANLVGLDGESLQVVYGESLTGPAITPVLGTDSVIDYYLVDVPFGTTPLLVKVFDGATLVLTYTIDLIRPVALADIEVAPVDINFQPSVTGYKVYVDQNVQTATITVSPGALGIAAVNGNAYIGPVTITLKDGLNRVVITNTYDGAVMTYVVDISRRYAWQDDSDQKDPKARRYAFSYQEMHGVLNGSNLTFGYDSYFYAVGAFKYGSNQNNRIELKAGQYQNAGTITISYRMYKFLAQRKVNFFFMNGEEVAYQLSLKDLKLSNQIKGPFDVETLVLHYEIADGQLMVTHVAYEGGKAQVVQEDKNKGKSNSNSTGSSSNNGKGKK